MHRIPQRLRLDPQLLLEAELINLFSLHTLSCITSLLLAAGKSEAFQRRREKQDIEASQRRRTALNAVGFPTIITSSGSNVFGL
jgi:hypothetical protein